MRRKIALGLTALVTIVLMILRAGLIPAWNTLTIGSMDAAHLMPLLIVLITIVLTVLCFQKAPAVCAPSGFWKLPCGWIATFTGVILAMTMLYDTVITLKILPALDPPPNELCLNDIDQLAMFLMLLCGIVGGVFLTLLGLAWMSDSGKIHPVLPWLSITPTLWMWFRLARYEISYASTVDISENVFDFSTMIFASLFLIQYARASMSIGKAPKNSVLLFALCTAMVTLSGIPSEFMSIADTASLTVLLMAVLDVVIGLLATVYAVMIVFSVPEEEFDPDEYNEAAKDTPDDEFELLEELVEEVPPPPHDAPEAWEVPAEPPVPVEPPFDMHHPIPEEIAAPVEKSAATNRDIDDILAQIDDAL